MNKYIENPPTAWEIPAEYLTDERFNTLITEAEKYLGYPYVWGGSSPSTSFDCSGFVSYVLTNSGPVSYTHLIRECARAALMDGEAVADRLTNTCEAAVSYTHLDVYKRQGWISVLMKDRGLILSLPSMRVLLSGRWKSEGFRPTSEI